MVKRSNLGAAEEEEGQWLRSSDARKIIKASSCDLSHMRQKGKIRYRKEGNAYLYNLSDLQKRAKSSAGS
jgi:hypothetical protein